MKHLVMTRPKKPPAMASSQRVPESDGVPETAFELWLQRSLHQLFDKVAKEPIPDELLRLIEQDRKRD